MFSCAGGCVAPDHDYTRIPDHTACRTMIAAMIMSAYHVTMSAIMSAYPPYHVRTRNGAYRVPPVRIS